MWLVLLKTSAASEVGSAEAKPQPWRASLYTDKDSLLNKVWRSLFDSDESTARVNNCSLKMILNTLPAWSLPLFRQVNHLLSCQSHSNLWPSHQPRPSFVSQTKHPGPLRSISGSPSKLLSSLFLLNPFQDWALPVCIPTSHSYILCFRISPQTVYLHMPNTEQVSINQQKFTEYL